MPTIFTRTRAAFVAGAVTAMPAITGEEFFEHKFITNKDPDAIVDFYSTEDFLQILGVFPFAIHFVLAGVEWETDRENTMSVHNAMEISFEITEREEETADGEKVVAFFQKRERFKNFIPFTRFLMWDQTQCYGYNRREDGSIEVFHRGASFVGPLPVRWLVQLHAHYVIWATEKHINSPAFGVADLEVQEEQRSNVPLHAFHDFLSRLSIAHKVAIESGKLAVGGTTEDAEKTLKKLQRLKETPTTAYVNTLRKKNLKRSVTSIEMSDAEAQRAIDNVLGDLARSKDGQDAAAEALKNLMKNPEVEKMPPRYGGAFNAKELKGHQALASVAAE
jgi:hypothetical protein